MGVIRRNTVMLTIISYVGVIIGYLNKILLFPNFLKTEEVGLTNTLVNVAVVYAQLSALGMPNIILKFFPYFQEKSQKHHGFIFWVSLLASIGFLFVTFLFIIFRPVVEKYYSENSPLLVEYYYYLIPLGAASVFFQLYDSYLRSLLKITVPALINDVIHRLFITLSISIYAIGWIDFKQFVMIYVTLNCMGSLLLVAYLLFLKQFFILPFYSPRIRKLRKIVMTYGLFSILSSAGIALMNSIDSLMIAGLMKEGLHYAGIYTTAMFISSVMLIPYRSMLKISSPIVSQLWKEKNMKKMEELYKKFTLTNIIVGGFVFLLLWANIENIFRFLPAEYASGKYVFLFIGLGRFFDMICGLNGHILLTSKKYRYDLFFIVILIFTMVGANYLFIKIINMGINGAAIATMLCVMMYNMLRIGFVLHWFKIHPFEIKNIWVAFIAGVCLLVNYFIPYLGNLYLDAGVRTAIIGGLFVVPIFWLKISPDINSFVEIIFARIRTLFP